MSFVFLHKKETNLKSCKFKISQRLRSKQINNANLDLAKDKDKENLSKSSQVYLKRACNRFDARWGCNNWLKNKDQQHKRFEVQWDNWAIAFSPPRLSVCGLSIFIICSPGDDGDRLLPSDCSTPFHLPNLQYVRFGMPTNIWYLWGTSKTHTQTHKFAICSIWQIAS